MDVLIALGTHPPMSDEAINHRLGITDRDRQETYRATRFFNHRWADPAQLVSIGTITADEVSAISGGRMTEPVNVTINRLVFEYYLLPIISPTFPHPAPGLPALNNSPFPSTSYPP